MNLEALNGAWKKKILVTWLNSQCAELPLISEEEGCLSLVVALMNDANMLGSGKRGRTNDSEAAKYHRYIPVMLLNDRESTGKLFQRNGGSINTFLLRVRHQMNGSLLSGDVYLAQQLR